MSSMIRWMLLVATHIISHEPAAAMGAGPRHVHPWGCSAKSPATWSSRGDGRVVCLQTGGVGVQINMSEHFFKLLEELRTCPDFLNLRRMQPIVFYIFYIILHLSNALLFSSCSCDRLCGTCGTTLGTTSIANGHLPEGHPRLTSWSQSSQDRF